MQRQRREEKVFGMSQSVSSPVYWRERKQHSVIDTNNNTAISDMEWVTLSDEKTLLFNNKYTMYGCSCSFLIPHLIKCDHSNCWRYHNCDVALNYALFILQKYVFAVPFFRLATIIVGLSGSIHRSITHLKWTDFHYQSCIFHTNCASPSSRFNIYYLLSDMQLNLIVTVRSEVRIESLFVYLWTTLLTRHRRIVLLHPEAWISNHRNLKQPIFWVKWHWEHVEFCKRGIGLEIIHAVKWQNKWQNPVIKWQSRWVETRKEDGDREGMQRKR